MYRKYPAAHRVQTPFSQVLSPLSPVQTPSMGNVAGSPHSEQYWENAPALSTTVAPQVPDVPPQAVGSSQAFVHFTGLVPSLQ